MKKHHILITLLLLIAYVFFAGMLFAYNLLPMKERLLALGLLAILIALIVFGLTKAKKWGEITLFVVSGILIILLFFISYSIYSTYKTLNKISSTSHNKYEEYIDLEESLGTSEISIDEEEQKKLKEKKPASEEEIDAVLEELAKKSKIYGAKARYVGFEEPFNVIISGIDQYGDISVVSRSDVNILMTVQPKRHRIRLTTIPRDSYVSIAGGGNGGYDKLTHAGIYGIGSTVRTIENLFEIPIHYYIRVNFSSLIDLVDVLGGIEVNSPYAFSAGGYQFSSGMNFMDGKKALAFSRERYSLPSGDLDRGRNQERVIEGMIRRANSPDILLHYNQMLHVFEKATESNLASEKITELVNNQIKDSSPWQVESSEVSGYGTYGLPSYAMPGWNLYMFQLDQDSIMESRREIAKYFVKE